MIDDLKERNVENMALITMVLDEVERLYNLKTENRVYEIERLETALVTSLYMINERVQDINILVDKLLEVELQKRGQQ